MSKTTSIAAAVAAAAVAATMGASTAAPANASASSDDFSHFTGWTRISPQLASAFDEGDAPQQNWEHCAEHVSAKPFTVVCPNGFTMKAYVASHSHKNPFTYFGEWQKISSAEANDLNKSKPSTNWSHAVQLTGNTTVYVAPNGRHSTS